MRGAKGSQLWPQFSSPTPSPGFLRLVSTGVLPTSLRLLSRLTLFLAALPRPVIPHGQAPSLLVSCHLEHPLNLSASSPLHLYQRSFPGSLTNPSGICWCSWSYMGRKSLFWSRWRWWLQVLALGGGFHSGFSAWEPRTERLGRELSFLARRRAAEMIWGCIPQPLGTMPVRHR